jgi:hypothetical protein
MLLIKFTSNAASFGDVAGLDGEAEKSDLVFDGVLIETSHMFHYPHGWRSQVYEVFIFLHGGSGSCRELRGCFANGKTLGYAGTLQHL